MNGKAVQLRQGSELLLTDPRDPRDIAVEFARYGPVAIVDLDAALGTGENTELITECCRLAPCRIGGGIRTAESVKNWIKRGAKKVVIGTKATPEFLKQFPREWLIAAIDARGQDVVVKGWTETTDNKVLNQARILEPFCSEFLFTQVELEGMLKGADMETAKALRSAVDIPITVAGGISSIDEIRQLEELGCNSQLGRAIYENKLGLAEIWQRTIRFDGSGLVPTIVQDAVTKDVLMLAYSNAESLSKALSTGQGWYYSRSRKELWCKGATSGNTQKLLSASWDCDRDTVLFSVVQQGPACHRNTPTCFGDRGDNVLTELENTLQKRKNSDNRQPYTCKLLDNSDLVAAKLREEIEEVIEAKAPKDITWEAADVLYHLLVRMHAAGVTMTDVLAELRSRFKPSQ